MAFSVRFSGSSYSGTNLFLLKEIIRTETPYKHAAIIRRDNSDYTLVLNPYYRKKIRRDKNY